MVVRIERECGCERMRGADNRDSGPCNGYNRCICREDQRLARTGPRTGAAVVAAGAGVIAVNEDLDGGLVDGDGRSNGEGVHW
ncbi:hypothetical protein L227DRAFT_15325 [Lentinus tigrinus ALCF2SS1-6]|uniref:Uncharacterized protein n=1 Tax=Lentinus tigrinus ALCF2SS1-6 TaxID=1328759 RepID=A0A5C2SVP3_9APHY|nr:hypothetical protein L227DRAFT_15325 [Lentinus tigrinus ALCF2SS1-6]